MFQFPCLFLCFGISLIFRVFVSFWFRVPFYRVLICLQIDCSHSIMISGDGEGGIEMTESMQLIREFCDRFISSEKATRTRIVIFLI